MIPQDCVYNDIFGYWKGLNESFYPLPKYTEESLEDASIKRVKKLGYKNILWSGGVDSTFIVCSYIKAKVPFTVICDNNGVEHGSLFYEWMLKNNINIIKFNKFYESYKIEHLLSGSIACHLFSPDEKERTYSELMHISFYDNMSHLKDRDRLYEQIQEYGRLLGKPTDTNEHIIRLINFGSKYISGRDEMDFLITPIYKIYKFFDTSNFFDIAWSQYWERDVIDDKPEMHRFICEVTQDDRMMYNVYRHGLRHYNIEDIKRNLKV